VRLLACETLFPERGPLPVMAHFLAMMKLAVA